MAESFCEVGKAFTDHYYQTMMNNRSGIANLYQDDSCVTYEGTQVQGKAAIMQKIGSLSYANVKYAITTRDYQPVLGVDGDKAIVITTMGQLQTDEDRPQSFIQSFLLRIKEGNFYVANETFRVVLHNVPP